MKPYKLNQAGVNINTQSICKNMNKSKQNQQSGTISHVLFPYYQV